MTGQISRDHYSKVISAADGFEIPVVCMIGGKWTTFRAFGEQAADRIMEIIGVKRQQSTTSMAIGGTVLFFASQALQSTRKDRCTMK